MKPKSLSLVASCKQLSVVEPLETVLREVLSHVELLETGQLVLTIVFLCFFKN